MTTNDIDAIRNLADATEPDWVAETNDKGHAWINLPAYHHAWGMHGFPDEAKFAAAARHLVPALCDEIEQLRAQLAEAHAQCRRLNRELDDTRAEREHMELHPTGTVEWLKSRVAELIAERDSARAELAAERTRTQETHQ